MPSGYRERGRQTDRAEWSGVKRARGSCCGVSCTHPLCRDLRRFRRLKSGSRTIDRVRKSLSPSLARPESPRSPLVLREVASFSQVYFTSPVERGRRSGRDKTGDADGRRGEGGRVVPLPSSPKEGNAPCVPRVVLSLCLWREGATCSMLYFQFLFLCISVLNNLRSTFALAAQPLPIALAPLCHGHLIRDTQCRDERI